MIFKADINSLSACLKRYLHPSTTLAQHWVNVSEQSVENIARKSSTKYKKIVHKAYTKNKQKIIHKLDLLQSENPKEYWIKIKAGKNVRNS